MSIEGEYLRNGVHVDHSAMVTVSRVSILREGDCFKSLN